MMYSRYTPNGSGGFDRHRVPRRPPRRDGNLPSDPPRRDGNLPSDSPRRDGNLPSDSPRPPKPPGPPAPCPPPPPKPGGLLQGLLPSKLDKGDLLMLAILYLVFSENEDDKLLPLLAVGLYLFLK